MKWLSSFKKLKIPLCFSYLSNALLSLRTGNTFEQLVKETSISLLRIIHIMNRNKNSYKFFLYLIPKLRSVAQCGECPYLHIKRSDCIRKISPKLTTDLKRSWEEHDLGRLEAKISELAFALPAVHTAEA